MRRASSSFEYNDTRECRRCGYLVQEKMVMEPGCPVLDGNVKSMAVLRACCDSFSSDRPVHL